MDAAAPTPLHATLTARRLAITERWYGAVARTGFAPLGGPAVRARLLALTDRAIAALLAEPFVPDEARAIGAALAELHYLHPAALEGTLAVLGAELAADLPPAATMALRPRLAALLGAVAGGYYAAACDAILAEQEAARAPLLAEQRRIEVALRASEARLRAVVTNSPVLLFALDRDGVFTLAEGKGLAALGLTPEAVVGRAVEELFAAVPTLAREVRRALAGEDCAAIAEVGGVVIEARHTPVRDETGAIVGVIGVATDVTVQRQAEAERDAVRRRLTAVREEERLALARELHDEAIQELLGIRLALQLGKRDLGPDAAQTEVVTLLNEGSRALREVVERLRRIVGGLRPAGLEELGLVAALEGYAAHVRRKEAGVGLAVALDLDPAGATLPPDLTRAFFRVAQEGLRNVRRHAGATRVGLTLRVDAAWATLRVEDDGRGFAPPAPGILARTGHFGLVGLAEQLADLGGTLVIASRPGRGTTLVARAPLETGEGDDG